MTTIQCGTSTFIGIELTDEDFKYIENASQKYYFNFSNEQVKNFLQQDPKFKENLNEREKKSTAKLLINMFARTLEGLKN